jgi:nucleoside-diphosphate-sugar epimerase
MTRRGRRRILVTGAGGFIGGHLLRTLPNNWAAIPISTRCESLGAEACISLDDLRGGTADVPGDLDAVIHLAGNSNHTLAQEAPWQDIRATALIAAEILGRARARQLVVLSSAAVYAGREGLVSPATDCHPHMAYALSKLFVEGLAETLADDGRYEMVTIFRLYNAFGPGERPGRLIPRIAAAVASRESFQLTGDPASLSDPLHVDEVGKAIVAAVDHAVAGTYDLCGGDPQPLASRVRRISAVLGQPDLELKSGPSREGEVPIQFWSDSQPTWDSLGLSQPETFDAAVGRYAHSMGWLPA